MTAKCINPVILKSGLAVPCGKCEICRSHNRNDWSVRVQMQCRYAAHMPLMIGLDYAPDHLPMTVSGEAVLNRDHVSAFLKAYKRKYNLTNDKFLYFGCGEYGGRVDRSHRPHYHLVFFGDEELYNLYWIDEAAARSRLSSLWKYGRAWVGLAQWSGIHYITKYVLKDETQQGHSVPPFTISCKNLGMNYLDSPEADEIRKKLSFLQYNRSWIYKDCPAFSIDDYDSILHAIEYFRQFVPKFEVELESGKFVCLPRIFRRKLVGSYEHFKDNPLWLPNYLQMLKTSLDYERDFGDYDRNSSNTTSFIVSTTMIQRIRKRLNEYNYNKNRLYEQL